MRVRDLIRRLLECDLDDKVLIGHSGGYSTEVDTVTRGKWYPEKHAAFVPEESGPLELSEGETEVPAVELY